MPREVIGLAGQGKRFANLLQLAVGDNRRDFKYPRRINIGRRILQIHPDKEARWKGVVFGVSVHGNSITLDYVCGGYEGVSRAVAM
jgi:hypothetical protein